MYEFSRVWSIFFLAESAKCLVFFYFFFLLCVAKSILQYAHIYSVIIPFIVKNTIRDKYRKNCFSDGVKLRHNLLKECVSKRLGPFLLYVSGRINFCITLSVIFAPTRKSIMKVVQLAKITFYRWFFRQWCVSFEKLLLAPVSICLYKNIKIDSLERVTSPTDVRRDANPCHNRYLSSNDIVD